MDDYWKEFIRNGLIGVLVLIVYEIIIMLLSPFLGLFTLVLGWAPLFLLTIVFKNLILILISTLILFFLLGGIVGIIIKKILF